jgi:transcriptional regulator with XRE-family HTH domain
VSMKKAKKRNPRAPTAVDAYIGAQMRDRRTALDISQTALGEKLGVTFQQIQKYESGENRVSAARLFEICEVLDVSLASMFERKLKA